MPGLFKSFRSKDEAQTFEEKFEQILNAHAERLKVSPDLLLANLHDALALPTENDVTVSRGKGKRQLVTSGAREVESLASAEDVSAMPGLNALDPDQMREFVAHLARPTESPDNLRVRSERAQLMRKQRESFKAGLRADNELEIVTPPPKAKMASVSPGVPWHEYFQNFLGPFFAPFRGPSEVRLFSALKNSFWFGVGAITVASLAYLNVNGLGPALHGFGRDSHVVFVPASLDETIATTKWQSDGLNKFIKIAQPFEVTGKARELSQIIGETRDSSKVEAWGIFARDKENKPYLTLQLKEPPTAVEDSAARKAADSVHKGL